MVNLLCWHLKQTTPRRDKEGEYCRCLECGARLPWSWEPDGQGSQHRMPSHSSNWPSFASQQFKSEQREHHF
jgi:hypothetical protein